MAGIDPFASITGAVLDLLMRDGDLFLTLGTNLFRGLAIILIAWFGIRAALTSAEGGGGAAARAVRQLAPDDRVRLHDDHLLPRAHSGDRHQLHAAPDRPAASSWPASSK